MNSKSRTTAEVTPSSLAALLKRSKGEHLKGLTRLKVVYRPHICPFHELLELIPEESRVFDLGCGAGTFLHLVAELRNPAARGGIEISEELVQSTEGMLSDCHCDLRTSVYDGQNIPDWIADYDIVTLIDVLHHVPPDQQMEFIRRIGEKMKKGAQLILKDINAESRVLVLFNKLHDFVVSREIGHELTAAAIGSQLEAAGFDVIKKSRCRMLVYPHVLFHCRKI